jgi:hypothetical protein
MARIRFDIAHSPQNIDWKTYVDDWEKVSRQIVPRFAKG